MIKLAKLLKELEFNTSPEEMASSYPGEEREIQDYVDVVKQTMPNGTTIADIAGDLKDAPQTTQIKAMLALAKLGKLKMSMGGTIKPDQLLKILNDKSAIAMDTLANANMNEKK